VVVIGYPVKPEQYHNRLDRLRKHAREDSVMLRIAPAVVFELKLVLNAYYGGPWRVIWALVKEQWWQTRIALVTRARIRFCDWMGWTKVYYYPETERMVAHYRRHGSKCSGSPNCGNDSCIEDSVPRWYQKLTRWDQ
jgi:hypothetical protein